MCDFGKFELILYYLVVFCGLLKFIKEIFRDGKLYRLNVDCLNKDGIILMYLVKLYSSNVIRIDFYNFWVEVV